MTTTTTPVDLRARALDRPCELEDRDARLGAFGLAAPVPAGDRPCRLVPAPGPRRGPAVLLGVCLLLAAGPVYGQPPPAPGDPDWRGLEGAWRIVAVQGAAKDDAGGKATAVTFRRGEILFTFAGDRGTERARCKIDSGRSPKRMDFEIKVFASNVWAEGIYSLHGDTLTLCFGDGKKGRPTRFDASAGSGRVVVRLERVRK
jgi:uncharacterized protein (TIGR03067 family)